MTTIAIPADLPFSSLNLARDRVGTVSFNWSVIEKLCSLNGIDPEQLAGAGEDSVGEIIVAWYAAHKQAGGACDPVAEDLIAEVEFEDHLGSGLSHQPGSA